MIGQIKKYIKSLFCKHKNYSVINWYWTHGVNGNEPSFIIINYKCLDCDRLFSLYLTQEESYKWIEKNSNFKDLQKNIKNIK